MSIDDDPFTRAHLAAHRHLDVLDNELVCTTEEEAADTTTLTLGGAPYCGCRSCEIREALAAAWPHLREAALAGEQPDLRSERDLAA
jgi:hypothetical protein